MVWKSARKSKAAKTTEQKPPSRFYLWFHYSIYPRILLGVIIVAVFFALCLLLQGCKKDETAPPNPIEDKYYLSVKIMRMENGEMIPHSGPESRLAYVIKSDGTSIYGVIHSDGWLSLLGTPAFAFDDEIHLKIYGKYEEEFVETPTFSPRIASNFFVKSMGDFKTNLPPEGYHFLVLYLH